MSKKKIAVVLPNLGEGGAQKVFLDVFSVLAKKFEVHVIVLLAGEKEFPHRLDNFNMHYLNYRKTMMSLWALHKVFSSIRPDVVFSALFHVNIIVAFAMKLSSSKPRFIMREANTASVELEGMLNLPARLMMRWTYSMADCVICLSKHMKKDLVQNFGLPEKILEVVYNPANITLSNTPNPYFDFGDGPHILAVGRLHDQKNYPHLIKCFACLLKSRPKAQLWILGKGDLLNELKNLAISLNVNERVHFEGFQADTATYYLNADLFVMTSKYEGTPNVLMEALAAGCPVLIRKHHGGTKEVMEILGISDRYVDEIEWDDSFFNPLPESVEAGLKANFSLSHIASEYEKLI